MLDKNFYFFKVTSLKDCVSLEHLGRFLEMIEYHIHATKLPNRTCPEFIHVGRPTLIFCSKADMWRSILSIYMDSKNAVLPSASEVLVCCQSTTAEEIELLFRRAIQKPYHQGNNS